MQNERIFTFRDEGELLQIKIPEKVDPSYGSFTWSSAPVLAQYIWYNRRQIKDKVVIELGAGTSLPGVLAALCGAQVTLTDAEEHSQSLDNCRQSAKVNGLQDVIRVVGLTWGKFSPNIFMIPNPDIILGSDCFYDSEDFENILATVSFLLETKPDSTFWTTYQVRCTDVSIEDLLVKWGLTCHCIPLDRFDADQEEIGGCKLASRHVVQMLEIKKALQEFTH